MADSGGLTFKEQHRIEDAVDNFLNGGDLDPDLDLTKNVVRKCMASKVDSLGDSIIGMAELRMAFLWSAVFENPESDHGLITILLRAAGRSLPVAEARKRDAILAYILFPLAENSNENNTFLVQLKATNNKVLLMAHAHVQRGESISNFFKVCDSVLREIRSPEKFDLSGIADLKEEWLSVFNSPGQSSDSKDQMLQATFRLLFRLDYESRPNCYAADLIATILIEAMLEVSSSETLPTVAAGLKWLEKKSEVASSYYQNLPISEKLKATINSTFSTDEKLYKIFGFVEPFHGGIGLANQNQVVPKG